MACEKDVLFSVELVAALTQYQWKGIKTESTENHDQSISTYFWFGYIGVGVSNNIKLLMWDSIQSN